MQPSRNDTLFTRDHHRWAQSVIGGDGPNFRPVVRANLWNAECSVEFTLPGPGGIRPTFNAQARGGQGQIEWHGPSRVGMRAYPLDDGRFEAGGLEWEIILDDVPAQPTLTLDLDITGVDLFEQPPLTQWEIDRGNVRPANVVNSFAAYHSTRGPIHTQPGDGDKYGPCKAFHLFRPEAIDSSGARMFIPWTFNPVTKKLTLLFDVDPVVAAWLQNADYSEGVIIDPTIGYTSIGASTDNTNDYSLNTVVSTATAGDANPGTAFVYGSTDSGTANVYVAAYAYNASGPFDQARVSGASSAIGLTTTPGWRSAAITWNSIAASTNYILSAWSKTNGVNIYYDTGSATGWYAGGAGLPATPSDPFPSASSVDDGAFNHRVSRYVDYTASGAAAFARITGNPFSLAAAGGGLAG